MKLQFPVSIGVFVASFNILGCQVSDSEIPDRSYWTNDASLGTDVSDASAANADAAASAADGGNNAYRNDSGVSNEAGSSGGQAGQGGMAGGESEAGSGGTAGGDAPAAGSGGSDEPVGGDGAGGMGSLAGSGGMGGSGGTGGSAGPTCPAVYTMASHMVLNVSWGSNLALQAGSGQVHVWTKSSFDEHGNTATIQSKSCGSSMPPITTSALAGKEKILPVIPDGAWDQPNMPVFNGAATKTGSNVVADPGVALVGLTMSNPTATWPAGTAIMGVDHDSDGKLGITANAKQDSGYVAIPTNISRSSRADKVYLAIRNITTLNANIAGCPVTYTGTATVKNFDSHIIGCHVKNGGECDATQTKFVDDYRTQYQIGTASFTSTRIAANATCAQVRAALP